MGHHVFGAYAARPHFTHLFLYLAFDEIVLIILCVAPLLYVLKPLLRKLSGARGRTVLRRAQPA